MKTRAVGAALVLMLAVGLAACGDDDSDSGSGSDATTTTVNAECKARDDLKASVKALASPALLTGGKAGLQSAADDVKSDLDAVVSSTKDADQSDVDATKAAIDDLKKAISDVGDGNLTSNMQAIGSALANVGSTGEKLVSNLGADC